MLVNEVSQKLLTSGFIIVQAESCEGLARDIAGGLAVREDCTDMESVIHDHHPTIGLLASPCQQIDSDQEHVRSHLNRYSHGGKPSHDHREAIN